MLVGGFFFLFILGFFHFFVLPVVSFCVHSLCLAELISCWLWFLIKRTSNPWLESAKAFFQKLSNYSYKRSAEFFTRWEKMKNFQHSCHFRECVYTNAVVRKKNISLTLWLSRNRDSLMTACLNLMSWILKSIYECEISTVTL